MSCSMGTGTKQWKGDRRVFALQKLGGRERGTQKSPGVEITKSFLKNAVPTPGQQPESMVTAEYPCAPSQGLFQGCPLARGTRLLPGLGLRGEVGAEQEGRPRGLRGH